MKWCLWIFFLFPLVVLQAKTPRPQLITPPDVIAGKWIGTLAVGYGVPLIPAIQLRNALYRSFLLEQGGLYRVAFDFDDLGRGSPPPTLTLLRESIAKLKAEVVDFKVKNPQAPTSLILGLTGHGATDSTGQFKFKLADDPQRGTEDVLSGEELVQLLASIDVDEIILILQSCQSGSLPNQIFPDWAAPFLQTIKAEKSKPAQRMAVMTPVPAEINSPFFGWEQVLMDSFASEIADENRDGVVSYGEWINRLRRAAAISPFFMPRVYGQKRVLYEEIFSDEGGGIDPQFWSWNMSATTPMYLTQKGIDEWLLGNLTLPDPSVFVEPEFDQTTQFLYDQGVIGFFQKWEAAARAGASSRNRPDVLQVFMQTLRSLEWNLVDPKSCHRLLTDISHQDFVGSGI